MKDFRRLKIWERGMEIVRKTYSLSKQLPTVEKFGLASQVTRAAISIPSNIAEGSSRSTDKDKKRFAEIALGSAFELETQLLTIRDLQLANPVDADELNKLPRCKHTRYQIPKKKSQIPKKEKTRQASRN